jgi:hypothetical protein
MSLAEVERWISEHIKPRRNVNDEERPTCED